ncbi:MAG: hypothetical protein M1546_21350 [Chloroflexi bacterium]|nr:hypothetical protein [Chloroflexota bacterium]
MGIFQISKLRLLNGIAGQDRRDWDWAVASTYAAFTRMHPEWAASLFDMHFLTHRARPILEQYARGDITGTAHALANAWADQLSHDGEVRAQRVRELTPVADDFLCLFRNELARLKSYAGRIQGQTALVDAWPCEPSTSR